MLKIIIIITCGILLAWFFGCIVTYRIGKHVLVDGMGIKSAEFVMLCLFVASIVMFIFLNKIGKWALTIVLLLWLVIHFLCHCRYTIFGASEKKLKGYNDCFRNTVKLIPASDKRIIPDLYHIILHLLILSDLILSEAFIIVNQ